ncbi:MAG: hypothetical protein JSR27_04870 [Proteobacteria bacterium]|nr:hypothetical protein [Pseudomonadota bacterium]
MTHCRSPIIARLRAHRGLWLVCVATLLFKLFAGTVCMADAAMACVSSGDAAIAAVALDDANANEACLLGEAGDCHCTCAHATPVPSDAIVVRSVLATTAHTPFDTSRYTPTHAASALRPPIFA